MLGPLLHSKAVRLALLQGCVASAAWRRALQRLGGLEHDARAHAAVLKACGRARELGAMVSRWVKTEVVFRSSCVGDICIYIAFYRSIDILYILYI